MTGMGNAKRYFWKTYDGDGEHIYMTGTSAGGEPVRISGRYVKKS